MRPHEMNQFLIYCILFLFVMLILSIVLLFVSRPIYKFKAKYFPGEQDYEIYFETTINIIFCSSSSTEAKMDKTRSSDAVSARVIVSVACLFETRFFILYARETFWKHLRRPWLLFNYTIALTYMLPTYLAVPDQISGKIYQFGRYPCLPKEVYDEKVFLLSTWSTGVAYNSCLNTATQQALIIVGLIFWNMRKSTNGVKISKKTLEMHRLFLRALILQVTIPLVTVLSPLIINIFIIYNSYYNQGANNISICIMATHGLVSTMAMIYLHKSYWAVLMQILSPKWSNSRVFTLVHSRPQDFVS
ncbi:Protein CBR-SRH-276 [Caenorhabditis briggsae]|uniref:Protein CBR-SRH-276 n=1 Tax=Caenorhabditis briggsae TaxID=6238 RepID=A8XTN1_CAEBR|nr:Protein CBR-SRH-276 [Caenorhabditis briggsae]CAP36007.2 Protein CBR-SRH-276 [Caenorhabditis briggsae]